MNKWLKEFGFDFKVNVKILQNGSKEIKFEKNNFEVNLRSGGLGAENILPILSQLVASKDNILIFEEPKEELIQGYKLRYLIYLLMHQTRKIIIKSL